jgi:hypothetical protein
MEIGENGIRPRLKVNEILSDIWVDLAGRASKTTAFPLPEPGNSLIEKSNHVDFDCFNHYRGSLSQICATTLPRIDSERDRQL